MPTPPGRRQRRAGGLSDALGRAGETYASELRQTRNDWAHNQAFTDDALTVCPSCEGPLRKVFGNVGVTFKGSGFYATDSRSAGRSTSGRSSSGSGSSESTSSSSAESSSGGSASGSSGDSGKSAAGTSTSAQAGTASSS